MRFIIVNKIMTPSLFMALTSVLALLAAYISEYVFGLAPCLLCYYQRYVYFAVAAFSFAAILLIPVSRLLYNGLMILALIALATETAIAFFHMGVEYQWFEMLSGCKGSLDYLDSITTASASRAHDTVIPCDTPPFVYILSMAGWNMVYALIILIISTSLFIRNRIP